MCIEGKQQAYVVSEPRPTCRLTKTSEDRLCKWLFLEIGGPFCGCPCNKSPPILVSILGPLISAVACDDGSEPPEKAMQEACDEESKEGRGARSTRPSARIATSTLV